MNNILVSVIIITYNQEKYIAQAIESVLSQNVSFEYELIVSDDCSTDSTPQIISDFAAKHSKVRPVLNKINLKASKNYMQAAALAVGKYIVVFEGDDYWTDNNKLQKQVDFLNENPGYCAVSHPVELKDDNGTVYGQAPPCGSLPENEATTALFLKGVTFSCMATMYKADILLNEDRQKYFEYVTAHPMVADFALCMLFLNAGRVKHLPQAMSVYRVSGQDSVNSTSYNHNNSLYTKYADYLQVLSYSQSFFGTKYSFNRLYLNASASICIESLVNGGLGRFLNIFKTAPLKIKSLFILYLPYRCLKLVYAKLFKSGN